jgi:hypothetical protein
MTSPAITGRPVTTALTGSSALGGGPTAAAAVRSGRRARALGFTAGPCLRRGAFYLSRLVSWPYIPGPILPGLSAPGFPSASCLNLAAD